MMVEEVKSSFAIAFTAAFLKQLGPILKWFVSVLWEAYAEAEMPFGDTYEGMWHWVKMLNKEEEEGK